LNNIAKHAGASQVDIRLSYQPDAVELRIQDDGMGFDPDRRIRALWIEYDARTRGCGGAVLSIASRRGQGA